MPLSEELAKLKIEKIEEKLMPVKNEAKGIFEEMVRQAKLHADKGILVVKHVFGAEEFVARRCTLPKPAKYCRASYCLRCNEDQRSFFYSGLRTVRSISGSFCMDIIGALSKNCEGTYCTLNDRECFAKHILMPMVWVPEDGLAGVARQFYLLIRASGLSSWKLVDASTDEKIGFSFEIKW